MRHPLVTPILAVQRAYDQGGGGMLTASLAFFAFFTVMPTLLLLTSLLGFVIANVEDRIALVENLFAQLDPLYTVAMSIVENLAAGASVGTIVGLLGLLWGAAGFYGALEGSMQRIFPGPHQRDVVAVRVRGIVAVVLVLAGMIAAIVLTAVVPIVTSGLRSLAIDVGQLSIVIGPLIACGIAIVSCLVVYVAVPPDGPSVRAALLPAVVAGGAIGLLTASFSAVAQVVASAYLSLLAVGSVFIALVWFNLVFQILLYGAAFARLRRDDERRRAGPPTL